MVLLGAAMALALIAVPSALGGPGDSPEEAIRFPVPTSTVAQISAGHTWVMYSVEALAGQTIRVDAALGGANGGMRLGTLNDPYVLEGVRTSTSAASSTVGLTFMAPRTGSYLLAFNSETFGPYSLTATPTAPVTYKVGSIWAPHSARHARSFTVAARTFPAYNSVRSPIRFMIERKYGKRWRAYGSFAGKFPALFLSGSSTKTTSSIKMSRKGTYRVRARLSDAAHPSARYSNWRTVKLK
jgi:hypothetical protein